MEFHKISHPNIIGEEKQQMLSLNRRLETYLSRVKLLEEENALLAKEIQSTRYNNQEDWSRRRWMEGELRQARLEVDAAWRDRVHTELEVSRLAEELQTLEKQRNWEVQATMKAKTKLEQSRKELEVEQRAQVWLREKVNQMENELKFLIQTHEENVTHLEDALITQKKASLPPVGIQRVYQSPDVLQMGDEVYQRTMSAWQQAATAYQDQLARLEESFDQTRNRLTEVGKEKAENQLKLQTLEKEIVSAQEVRLHLENTVAQQRDKHCQELQEIQEYLEDLNEDKDQLGLQIDDLLQENRNLMQLKMSLGMEVATYRALLDGEALRGDVTLSNKPRHISITDAALNPLVVKKNYQTQFYASHRNSFTSPLCGKSTSPFTKREPEAFKVTPKISTKPADATLKNPYPKIIQDGAVENFRPQEVSERVTYAEPLSPPNEEETSAETPQDEDEEEKNDVDNFWEEKKIEEPFAERQVEFDLKRRANFEEEAGRSTTSNLMASDASRTKSSCILQEDLVVEDAPERETVHQQVFLVGAALERNNVDQKEMSHPETDVVLEPTFKSWSSSLEPECDFVESDFQLVQNINTAENFSNEESVEMRPEISSPVEESKGTDVGDRLYPDGEEMDTWDSVIERKVEVKTGDEKKSEEKKQQAEPEDDISSKEHEKATTQKSHDECGFIESQEGQQTFIEPEKLLPHDKEDEDDEEDSQNVSVSWRTELESDSYAQENTVADTRPLIRYKSDDTDANTQASHMDESESSDGEHERKTGEMEIGTWSDGRSKTFGTMEDLCEEVEEETVDEDSNLGNNAADDKDATTGHEESNDTESLDNMERDSEEQTEEHWRRMGRSYVELDEELEIDLLVEQELENLTTDSYSAHFSQRHFARDVPNLEEKSFEEVDEQEEGKASGQSDDNEHLFSSMIINQASEKQMFTGASVMVPSTDIKDILQTYLADKAAMMAHTDPTERDSVQLEDPNNLWNAQSPHDIAEYPHQEVTGSTNQFQNDEVEDKFPGWEVLGNPTRNFEMRNDEKFNKPEAADGGASTRQEEILKVLPNVVSEENDNSLTKDRTDHSHGFFFSDGKNTWESSFETGATPDGTHIKSTEEYDLVQELTDNRVWGNSENPNVVNGNSRVDGHSSKAFASEEQEHTHEDVKKLMSRNVVGRDSIPCEVEAESCSSEDEEQFRD